MATKAYFVRGGIKKRGSPSRSLYSRVNTCFKTSHTDSKSFMQDQVIASHTCFGGHVVVNC